METKNSLIEIEGLKWTIKHLEQRSIEDDDNIMFLKERLTHELNQTIYQQKQASYWMKKSFYWMEQAGVLTPEKKRTKEPGTLIQFKPKMINKKLAIMG